MLKGDTDTDTDPLISEISIPILILILVKYRISILIRYRYDTFGQKYRNFDTDTIVSKVSVINTMYCTYQQKINILLKTQHSRAITNMCCFKVVTIRTASAVSIYFGYAFLWISQIISPNISPKHCSRKPPSLFRMWLHYSNKSVPANVSKML